MSIFALVVYFACLPTALLDFAIPKWKADEATQIEDAYKWLHQATRGGEHAAPDRESARAWLDREWETLERPAPGEKFVEPLCPDGSIHRVNLRPLRAGAHERDALLEAFLTSARVYKAETDGFVRAWNELGNRLKTQSTWRLTHNEWTRLDRKMKPRDYQAVHHSEQYTQAHRPAYRVILESEIMKLRIIPH